MSILNPAPADRPDPLAEHKRLDGAFEEGRKEERAHVGDRADVERKAYDRGRRDERARRRGFPLLTLILLVGAAAGAAAIYLGVSQGSFARGGQVVDKSLAGAQASATQATHVAVAKTGDALQTAGANLKSQAQPPQPDTQQTQPTQSGG